MKKNNKGFTLVELLAVIVILGLLMAIAIPSVTKYITQSRIKTLVTTVDSYVTAVVNQVNDGEYKFSDSTKVYAIPIECVSLEKGGQSPFGNWMQANNAYWAYVLVHYDNENYNYEYGFTFKDDAGYGMYPTLNDKITNSLVKTGYDDLNQPKNGYAKDFVTLDKWEGFDIHANTELVVLQSESEGVKGNGETTCTLCQKGDNYTEVENSKAEAGSTNLVEAIKANNTIINTNPTLNKSSNNTSDASGLYSSTKTTNGNATYYFRGNVTNNYVDFAGLTWRIVRINEDGTIRIILEDVINNTTYKFTDSTGNYKNTYYSLSTIAKPTVDAWYQSAIVNKNLDSYVATGKFCEQSRVRYSSSSTNGSVTNTLYGSYTPTFACPGDANGKGQLELKAGLITYDEIVYAGAYVLQGNDKFYLYDDTNFIWTMSPMGVMGSQSYVWHLRAGGLILYFDVVGDQTNALKPVINLQSSVRVTGDGTKATPYKVVAK